MTVFRILECCPSGFGQRLGIVHDVFGSLKYLCTSEWRECVEVHTNDEVSIISHDSSQVIIDVVLVPFQLVEFLIYKLETGIFDGEDCRVVGRIEDGTCRLKKYLCGKEVLRFVVLIYCDVHRALDTFIFLKLEVGP